MQGSVWAGNNGIGARPWGYKGINMKIAVCDDEKVQCTLLSDYLGDWGRGRGILTEVICFPSGESLLFAWEEEVFDLLILDIEMGGISGMALAEKIRKENEDIPILFVTGYDEYMAQGYEVAALHYLLKPVHREKLFEVLDGLQRRKKPEEKLPFPTSGGYILLPASQIWYVEAMGKEKNIAVDAVALVPGKVSVSGVDLSVLIGNLLDNAMEACMELPAGKERFIRIYIDIMKKQLYIAVTNSMKGKAQKAGGRFLSRKEGTHGFGLYRIDGIVAKYGGYLKRRTEEGVFATEITLPLVQ